MRKNIHILPLLIMFLILTGVTSVQAQNIIGKRKKGISDKYSNDHRIETDQAVIFASGFEEGFTGWDSFNEKVSAIISSPGQVYSGKKALKSTATRGVNTGGDVVYKIKPAQDKIHLRFYTKFDEHTIIPHHFVKIYAMPGGLRSYAGNKPPGDKAFWTGIEPTNNQAWHFYSYWHEMHSWQSREGKPDGKRPNPYYGNTFNVPDQTPFRKGEWICIEAMLKANTPGQHDGEQAFWINGEKIGHWKKGEPSGYWRGDRFIKGGEDAQPFEGFNWRTSEDVKIDHIILRWYISREHMEKKKATHDENIVWFDNVVVATDYIGPMREE